MRTRSIVAGILIVVGSVWIGQGLGLIRGSSFMVDDTRWAIIGVGMIVAGSRHRRDRHQVAREALTHVVQVGSARPTVTSLPWRTSGTRSRRTSASRCSTISPSVIRW